MRKYASIFAGPQHQVITSIKQMRRWDNTMGFFLDGQAIGTGNLERVNNGNVLQTSSTEIFKKYRNKGHGIELYKALIETARSLGAPRIQSDINLNKYSRRMWRDKLSKIYTVRTARTKKPCNCCERPGLRWAYYWIDLTDVDRRGP